MPHTLGPSPRLFWVKLLLGQCVQIARLGACFSIKMYDCHRSELSPGKNPGLNVGNIRLQFSCWDVPSSFVSQRLPLGNTPQPKSSCLTLRMRILPCIQSLDDLIHGTSFTAWLVLWRKYVRSSTQWVELALRVQQLPLVAWSRLYRNMYGTTIEGTHSSLQFMLPLTPLQSLQLLRLPLHGYLIPHPPLTHFGKKNNSTKKVSPTWLICRFQQACKSTPVVLSGFPFLIIGFWQRVGGERSYQALFTGQWIFFTIWMYLWNAWVIHYSRFWSMTMGRRNDWWYLLPDFISLILFIPWPVYLD